MEASTSNTVLSCLISTNSNVMNYIGAYLYFDVNDHKWVRSGKSTGAGEFLSRYKQHKKQSKWQKGASSKFYLQYPSNTVTHTKSSNKSRKGYFENLGQFMAIGIDPITKP